MSNVIANPSAIINKTARIGIGTKLWYGVQVREGAGIGKHCILGKNVYIDHDVIVGNNCKIQNNASVYYGTTIEDGVFVGPHVCLANDKTPRAVTPEGRLKREADWIAGKTHIKMGASIGAGAVIIPGITVGTWAMVGAGSVVTKNVPDYGLVYGCPARLRGYICPCGGMLKKTGKRYTCLVCSRVVTI